MKLRSTFFSLLCVSLAASILFFPAELVQAQAYPIGKHSGPVGQDAVPIGEDAVPIGQGAVPIGQDAYPIGKNSGPVGQDAVPVGEDAVPVGEDAVPIGQYAYRIGKNSGPVGQDAVPVGEDSVPVGKDAVPVGKDAVPVGKDAVPVGKDAVPVGKDAVPTNLAYRQTRSINRKTAAEHPKTAHLFEGEDQKRWADAKKRLEEAIGAASPLSEETLAKRSAENKEWGDRVRFSAKENSKTVFTADWWKKFGSRLKTPAVYTGDQSPDAFRAKPTWEQIARTLGLEESDKPFEYVYDRNVTFHGDVIYVNGKPVASYLDFVESAKMIANSVETDLGPEWTPLGTFLLSTNLQSKFDPQAFQLAVDKSGNIAGTYAHWATGGVYNVHGKVNPDTQRVVFSIGSKNQLTFETGLANLTEDEVRLWAHLPNEHSQTWLLARID